MKTKWTILLSFIFALILLQPAYAQEEFIGPEGGDVLLSPQLMFMHMITEYDTFGGGTDTQEMGNLTINTTIGYFFTPQIELGGQISAGSNYSADIDFGDEINASLSPYFKFHFNFGGAQRVQPYIGAGAGIFYQKSEDRDDDSSFLVFGGAGLDIYFTEDTALTMGIQDSYIFIEDATSQLIMFLLGLSFTF